MSDNAVNERIQQEVNSSDVVLFMKGSPIFPQCGFSGQTVQVLKACQVEFSHTNVFEDLEIREGLKAYSQWPTYPQLYIDGVLIGGADIVMDLYQKGELQSLLANAGQSA